EKHLPLIEDSTQRKRIKHYVTENKRTEAALKAFENRDMKALGKLLTASHNSLKNDYEVSCDELDFLASEALETGYCLGSRMMGGGFGGCTINLVGKNDVSAFSYHITKTYIRRFNFETEINAYQSVSGAGVQKT
ncbi:MAG TPA: galactokinase, partial [Bacteroidia bacterium]|nr:galactokinase [Bacteroidia bacterium]